MVPNACYRMKHEYEYVTAGKRRFYHNYEKAERRRRRSILVVVLFVFLFAYSTTSLVFF
jgi:hypothetical protein